MLRGQNFYYLDNGDPLPEYRGCIWPMVTPCPKSGDEGAQRPEIWTLGVEGLLEGSEDIVSDV